MMKQYEEIEQNAATLSSDLTLTEDDRQLLADYSVKAYPSPRIKEMGVDREKKDPEGAARTGIQQYDKNGDGKLSRTEVPDGLVSLPELTGALKARKNSFRGAEAVRNAVRRSAVARSSASTNPSKNNC